MASFESWLCSAETHTSSRLLTLSFILNKGVVLLSEDHGGDQAELLGNLAESRLAYSLGHTVELAQMAPRADIQDSTPEDASREDATELSAFERELMALFVCASPR